MTPLVVDKHRYVTEQVASNKSSLLRKNILQNTQTLQLYTKNVN